MSVTSAFSMPFVCIVGAPRSGTTWLQAMLGAQPAVCAAQEMKLFDLFTGPWERAWRQLAELEASAGGGPRGLRALWTDDEFAGRLAALAGEVYARVLASKPRAEVILDKTPSYSLWVEHIKRVVPQTKFLHVIRDGRDVVVSLGEASRTWARSWAPRNVEDGAKVWRSMVLAARKAAAFDGCYLELRYEDLRSADGPAALARAFRFAGVAAEDADVQAVYAAHALDRMRRDGGSPFRLPPGFFGKGEVGGWKNALGARERHAFHAAAGDLLCELGYADASWWADRPYQRLLLPALTAVVRRYRRPAPKAEP